MTFKQKLLDEFIVVELTQETQSRIKLPDWQRTLRGRVLAVGPGRMLTDGTRAPMETKVGDFISFAATAGMDTSYGGKLDVRLMRDTDVDTVSEVA